MSDRTVLESIKAMELRLAGDPASLDGDALETWNRQFQAEVASAERGEDWPGIVERAQALSVRIQVVLEELKRKREEIRDELASHSQGSRALRAYNPHG